MPDGAAARLLPRGTAAAGAPGRRLPRGIALPAHETSGGGALEPRDLEGHREPRASRACDVEDAGGTKPSSSTGARTPSASWLRASHSVESTPLPPDNASTMGPRL